MEGIRGKSIVITGAASGIGQAAAILFARHGARLTLSDRDHDGGHRTLDRVQGDGGEAQFIGVDISRAADVQDMVAQAVNRYGRLDGAFNNAGIPNAGKRTHELSETEWRHMIDVNLTGTFLCVKYEVSAMLDSGGGAIVNTCSVGGLVHVPGTAEYTAAKHGVAGLTKAAAVDYGHDNIRVNAIAPGSVYTEMFRQACEINPSLEEYCNAVHPIGRFSTAEEQAQAAIWLLSSAASFVTGIVMPVDGGYTAV